MTRHGTAAPRRSTLRPTVKQALASCFAVSVLLQCGGNDRTKENGVDKTTTPLAAETQALRRAYAANNRNDIDAMVEEFEPQIEWTEPAEYPGAGTYHGRDAVKAHLAQARESWAEGSCEPERLIVEGDKVVVFVHVRVRLKGETEWREARLADVYTFREGKAVHMRAFADRRQALEWAGARSGETS